MEWDLVHKVLSISDKKEWENLIDYLPLDQQDVYYLPNYYKLYEGIGHGQAQCFVLTDGSNIALYPYLLNSINDLGYDLEKKYYDIQGCYGYNGVISNNYVDSFIKKFKEKFRNYCLESNIVAEFTRLHPLIENHQFNIWDNIILNRISVYLNIDQ